MFLLIFVDAFVITFLLVTDGYMQKSFLYLPLRCLVCSVSGPNSTTWFSGTCLADGMTPREQRTHLPLCYIPMNFRRYAYVDRGCHLLSAAA